MPNIIKHLRSIGFSRGVTLMVGAAGATALFVWTLGFAVTTLSQRGTLAVEMTTPYDCWVSTGRAGGAAVKGFGIQELVPGAPTLMLAPEVIEAAKTSTLVESLDAISIFRAQVRYEGFTALSTTPPLTMGMAAAERQLKVKNEELRIVKGRWPSGDSEVAVFDSMFTDRDLAVPEIGTILQLSTGQGVHSATLVGLIKGRKWVGGFPTGFVSDNVMRTLMPDFADPSYANLLLFCTGRDDAAAELREELVALCGDDKGFRVVDRKALVAELQTDLLKNFSRQAPLLLVLAVLMAACLIGTATRISVQSRLRVFAQYRILGMTRRQLTRFIVNEISVLLAVAWVIGCAVGFAILVMFTRLHAEDFPDGIPIVVYVFAPICALVLLALCSGASVMRRRRSASPFEPMELCSGGSVIRRRITDAPLQTILGIFLTPLLLFFLLPFQCTPITRSALILLLGIPSHLLGLYLILPALLRAVDHVVSFKGNMLLRNSTGRSYGRTQALVVTLMTGLGSYCAIQIWGASMIAPFIPSRELPDVIASFEPGGLPSDAMERFAQIEGVRDFKAFNAEQYVLDEATLDKIECFAGSRPMQNNILLINAEGSRHLPFTIYHLPFACVIPAMFARQGGFKIGDDITIRRVHPDGNITTHSWEITGIVDLNWHLFTARAGLRGRNGAPFGTLAPVFVNDPGFSSSTLKRFAWFDLGTDTKFEDVDTRFKELLAQIRNEGGAQTSRQAAGELRVTLHQRDEIAEGTQARGNRLVGALARLPFYALVLLTVGIVAIVQANIQSRENEFAMLRGIGMTRRQLFALLRDEVALLLVCGIAASVLFGVCVGWVFTAWTRAWMPFGGLPIQLHIPWVLLLKGVALTLTLGITYAMIPIIGFMRRQV